MPSKITIKKLNQELICDVCQMNSWDSKFLFYSDDNKETVIVMSLICENCGNIKQFIDNSKLGYEPRSMRYDYQPSIDEVHSIIEDVYGDFVMPKSGKGLETLIHAINDHYEKGIDLRDVIEGSAIVADGKKTVEECIRNTVFEGIIY